MRVHLLQSYIQQLQKLIQEKDLDPQRINTLNMAKIIDAFLLGTGRDRLAGKNLILYFMKISIIFVNIGL
jgi:hypothetical protein